MAQGAACPPPKSAVPVSNAELRVFREGIRRMTKCEVDAKNNTWRKLISFKWEAKPTTPQARCFLPTRSKPGVGKFSRHTQRHTANKYELWCTYHWGSWTSSIQLKIQLICSRNPTLSYPPVQGTEHAGTHEPRKPASTFRLWDLGTPASCALGWRKATQEWWQALRSSSERVDGVREGDDTFLHIAFCAGATSWLSPCRTGYFFLDPPEFTASWEITSMASNGTAVRQGWGFSRINNLWTQVASITGRY